jgi:hypothetical protein
MCCFQDENTNAVFERTQLFQGFGAFEGRRGQRRQAQQAVTPVDIQTDVSPCGRGR